MHNDTNHANLMHTKYPSNHMGCTYLPSSLDTKKLSNSSSLSIVDLSAKGKDKKEVREKPTKPLHNSIHYMFIVGLHIVMM